jgi:hypothetical protein
MFALCVKVKNRHSKGDNYIVMVRQELGRSDILILESESLCWFYDLLCKTDILNFKLNTLNSIAKIQCRGLV